MTGIESVAHEFRRFTEWLDKARPETLHHLERLSNGFEGWIKIEFLLWLTAYRTTPLALSLHVEDGEGDVGAEYNLVLDKRYRGMDKQRPTKRCDLWIRDAHTPSFHYIELKAPFANTNRGKVIDSAADDFWCMSRLRRSYENAVSGNAIVLGVRFTEDEWRKSLDQLLTRAECNYMEPADEDVMGPQNHIRWCVFTHRYDT